MLLATGGLLLTVRKPGWLKACEQSRNLELARDLYGRIRNIHTSCPFLGLPSSNFLHPTLQGAHLSKVFAYLVIIEIVKLFLRCLLLQPETSEQSLGQQKLPRCLPNSTPRAEINISHRCPKERLSLIVSRLLHQLGSDSICWKS